MHRDKHSDAVTFLGNTDWPAVIDEYNVAYYIQTLCQRAPGFGERVRVDIGRCSRYAEQHITWANASDRHREAMDHDYRRVFREVWFYSVNPHHDCHLKEEDAEDCDAEFEFCVCRRTWRFPTGFLP